MALSAFGNASNPADNGTANEPTTLAVTGPASMLAGDLVLLIGVMRSANNSLMSQSALGGQTWFIVRNPSNAGANNVNIAVWACEFNGTWSADPSIAFASALGTVATTGIMLVFRGIKNWANDVAVSAAGFAAPGSPFTVTQTGITTAHTNALAVAIFLAAAANTWGTLSGAGWALVGTQWRNVAGSGLSAAIAWQGTLNSGVATGNVSLNESAGTAGAACIFSLSGEPLGAKGAVELVYAGGAHF